MAKYSTTVEYNIQTRLDASGLTQLQAQLRQCETELSKMREKDLISQNQLNAAQNRLRTYREALTQSFNALTKTMDVSKFNEVLTGRGSSIQKMATDLNSLGAAGQRTFNSMVGALGRLDTGLKTTSKTTDKIFNTLGNTVRWGLIASAFQEVMNSAHNAVSYMQDLDRSLTDIMLVSNYTKEEMREFAQYANEAAAGLGNTTVAYTDAAMIYAQQGYNLADQKKLADMTLKVANVTGQETSEVSEQMTSIINGYGLAVDDLGKSMDQIAKIANISAADVEELAVASSRVAATASALGVEQSQLYSQIGTIVSVTREAPEVVGNALKTIYARFGDLKMGETLEDGVDLGAFSGALAKLGVNVLDANGQMREMGTIIEELMQKWNTFDRATQQSAAVTLAGKFQYNRLMTLMNNQDMYYQYLEEAENNSLGTLDEMQSEYLDSLEGKAATLQATVEKLMSSLFDQSKFTPVIGFFTDLVNLVDSLVKGIGGGIPVLTAFSGILLRTFSQNIGRSISQNLAGSRAGKMAEASSAEALNHLQRLGGNESLTNEQEQFRRFAQFGQENASHMNKEQVEEYNSLLQQSQQRLDALASAEERHQANIDATNIKIAALNKTLTENNQVSLLSDSNRFAPFGNNFKDIDTSGITQEINKLTSGFDKVATKIKNGEISVGKYQGTLNNLQKAAKGVQEVFGNSLDPIFKKMQDQLNNNTLSAEEFAAGLQKVITRMSQATSAEGYNSASDMESGKYAVDTARDANTTQDLANRGFEQGQLESNQYESIMNVTGAVGQLAFAWQSFQSLGSLWGNTNMELGEKLTQTVLNLAMTLPMLISGFHQLQEAKVGDLFTEWASDISTFANEHLEGAIARLRGTATTTQGVVVPATRAGAIGFAGLGAAATAASSGVRLLGTALQWLTTGPGIALMAALTIIPMVLQGIEAAHQAEVDAANEAAQETQAAADNVLQNTKKWNELYKTFSETHEVTAEFKSSAQEISDSLNVIGGDALIAAGNFEELNNAIAKAADPELTNNISAQQQVIDVNKDAFMGTWNNGSVAYDVYNAASKNGMNEEAAEIFRSVNPDYESGDRVTYGLSYEESYAGIKKFVAALKEEQQELQNTSNRTAEQEERLQTLNNTMTAVNKELNQDEWKQIDAAEQAKAQSAAQTSDFQSKIAAAGTDAQAIYDVFANDSNTAAYWSGLTTDAEKYAFAVANVVDEHQKLALQLETLKGDRDLFNIDSYDADQIKNEINSGDLQFYEGDSGSWKEMSADLTFNNKDMINETLSAIQSEIDAMPEKDQIQFYASLNKDSTLHEVLNAYADIKTEVENRTSLDTLSLKTEDELNLDEDVDLDTFEDLAETIYNASEASEVYSENLQEDAEALEDATEDQIRYTKALDKAVDKMDDWKEALESGDIVASTEAVTELRDEYADFLGMDDGSYLGDQFLRNADNLQLMEDAMNGVDGAYEQLQQRAAESILIQAGIDTSTIDTQIPLLWAELDKLNFADIQVGAQIDDAAFNDGILHIINDMRLAEGEAEALCQAMGINVDLEPGTAEAEGEQTYTDLVPVVEDAGTMTLVNPTGPSSVTTQQIPIQKVTYQQETHSVATSTIAGGVAIRASNGKGATGGGNLQIASGTHATKANTGGNKYQNSGGRPLSSRGSGGGGSGGKKGGGGGGSKGGGSEKTYEPKTKDPIEEEIDRYERVDTLLDDVEHKFDKVADEQDRLAGFDQADNMNEQIKLLEKQIALHKEKLAIQQQEAKELRDELSSQFGVTFDAEGFITNYAATHRRLENEVNSLVSQYNATGTEEGQEALEKQIEAAQDRLDKFKDKYQRYDELFAGDMNDTLKTLEDLEDQIEDLRIEALQTQVEAVENLKDLQETLIDFNSVFSGLDKDDPLRDMSNSAQKLAKYFDDGTASANDFYNTLISRTQQLMNNDGVTPAMRKWYQAQIDQMRAAQQAAGSQSMQTYGTGYLDMELLNLQMMMEQLNEFENSGASSVFGEDSGDLYEVAKDVFDSATDMIEEYEDEIENLKDAILDAIDEVGDRMDERREQFENITDELDHQREIAELLRGDENYDEINQLLQAQQNNYQASLGSLQDQLDVLKDLQAGLKEDSEEWKAVQEMIVDTQEELNDLVEESLDNLREQYENTVADIGNKWVDSALGTDLDWMEEQWELINRNADYYLDDTNAAYETQKLQSKYLDLLDNAGDLHTQQLITEQMAQQLGYLREKEKISEYDVKYAEMQIELLQKRIALEEAQRSKQQLKLRRDSQGNYNYVYTADNEATKAAQDEYLDAQNNAYNLSKEQMKQTQEDSLSALQNARKLIDDIWNDANLSLEEKKQRTQTIIDSLKEYLDGTSEQLSTSEQNIIQDFIGMVELMTDENAARLQDVYDQIIQGNIDAFDQIDTRWSDSLTDWLQNLDEFNANTDQMFQNLIDNAENYQDQTELVADLVEQNFDRVTDAVNKAKEATEGLAASNSDFINQLKNDAGVIQNYEKIMQEYADQIRNAQNSMKAYQAQVNELEAKTQAKERENTTLSSQVQDLKQHLSFGASGSGGYGGSGSGGGRGGGRGGSGGSGSGTTYTGRYYHDSLGSSPSGNLFSGVPGAIQVDFTHPGNPYSIHISAPSRGYGDLGWVKPSQVYDTGGYTGEWSGSGEPDVKDGKLAFLHSKELVLNATDTENILAAVEVARNMAASIKSGVLSGVASALVNGKGFAQTPPETVDQTVSITAEFPNATDADDIREAILGLSDQAFQYAHRFR